MPPKTKESKSDVAASSTYELGDTVLGKIRGYPPWPGQVVDPDDVPKTVAKERPQSKKAKFYCVRFLPTGDYGWIVPKDLSRLQKHEIDAYIAEPFRKNGDLLKGYKAALEPEATWESLQAGVQAAEDAEVDELQSDGEEKVVNKGRTAAAVAKKRKRDSEPAEKAAKASRPKKEPAEKKKPAVRKSKSKQTVESEDEAENVKPAPKKPKTEDSSSDNVKQWRHTLQKAFLSKDKPINADDMPGMNKTFTDIEKFDMSLENLSFSKIGKVMRHISKLEGDIPSEDQYHFRERAQVLVDKWGKLAGSSKANGSDDGAKEVNGKDEDHVGDLTVLDGDAKADATMDVDGAGDAEGEAEAEADADADAEVAAEEEVDTNGDAKMDEA